MTTTTEPRPLHTLKDSERSAYGLGWEAKRAGLTKEANPFKEPGWKWQAWRLGWNNYVPKG